MVRRSNPAGSRQGAAPASCPPCVRRVPCRYARGAGGPTARCVAELGADRATIRAQDRQGGLIYYVVGALPPLCANRRPIFAKRQCARSGLCLKPPLAKKQHGARYAFLIKLAQPDRPDGDTEWAEAQRRIDKGTAGIPDHEGRMEFAKLACDAIFPLPALSRNDYSDRGSNG